MSTYVWDRGFVEKDFLVPSLKTKEFTLRMLTINDLDKDYEAVMSSIDNLKKIFGPDDTWPLD